MFFNSTNSKLSPVVCPMAGGLYMISVNASLLRSCGGKNTASTRALHTPLRRTRARICVVALRTTGAEKACAPGAVVTHRQLLADVWGADQVDQLHYLRIYMGHLRAKIEVNPAEPRYLLTELGVGYRLADE